MRKQCSQYLLFVATLFLGCCLASAQFSDPGLQKWTDGNGKTIEARLLQYDPNDKSVRFSKELVDVPIEYQLRDLNLPGKIQALTHPNFFNGAQYSLKSDVAISSIITLSVWGLILFVALAIVCLFAYLLSSRIVMGPDPIRFKVNGYLRLFFIYVFFFLIGVAAIVGCVLILKSKPELANSAAGLCGTIVGFITVVISVIHLKKYYDVSSMKSIVMLVVYGFVATFFLLLFVGAIAGVAYYGFNNFPGLTDGILSNLVLKPMRLI